MSTENLVLTRHPRGQDGIVVSGDFDVAIMGLVLDDFIIHLFPSGWEFHTNLLEHICFLLCHTQFMTLPPPHMHPRLILRPLLQQLELFVTLLTGNLHRAVLLVVLLELLEHAKPLRSYGSILRLDAFTSCESGLNFLLLHFSRLPRPSHLFPGSSIHIKKCAFGIRRSSSCRFGDGDLHFLHLLFRRLFRSSPLSFGSPIVVYIYDRRGGVLRQPPFLIPDDPHESNILQSIHLLLCHTVSSTHGIFQVIPVRGTLVFDPLGQLGVLLKTRCIWGQDEVARIEVAVLRLVLLSDSEHGRPLFGGWFEVLGRRKFGHGRLTG
mmetsp:Transcript_31780/g.58237  ORF Transcript_31780/g.58237 Transcript_31780/m.58237 type:complete len:322 (-) Transcript_31780:1272-2237(-)